MKIWEVLLVEMFLLGVFLTQLYLYMPKGQYNYNALLTLPPSAPMTPIDKWKDYSSTLLEKFIPQFGPWGKSLLLKSLFSCDIGAKNTVKK